MKNIPAPKYVLSVLDVLEERGAKAYLVGGCVRDCIMGRRPLDWDICTSALPEEVASFFEKSRPTGIKHGTVTVYSAGHGLEITTFRSDGDYHDHRRPDSVSFIPDLEGDLKRRDFTINAMAQTRGGQLIDPFGGRGDIAGKTIRCVGEPDKRFGEDALRMLRALRFSAVLGFEIEGETLASIRRNAHLLRHVAPERVCLELEKTLLSNRPEVLADIFGLFEFEGMAARPAVANLQKLKRLPKDRKLRFTALCALLKAQGAVEDVKVFLTALKPDGETIRCAGSGSALALRLGGKTDSGLLWKKQLAKEGETTCLCAAGAMDVLYGGESRRALQKIIAGGEPYSLKALEVGGEDLQALGFAGRELGGVLDRLLQHVIEKPEDNKRDILLNLLKNFL